MCPSVKRDRTQYDVGKTGSLELPGASGPFSMSPLKKTTSGMGAWMHLLRERPIMLFTKQVLGSGVARE